MKLTRKFIAALVGGVAIVAMFQAFFDYRRERDVFDSQMRAEASALGRALARGMAEVWARDGEAAAREFLNTTSNQNERIRARWFWLDSQRDAPRASRETLAAMKENFVVVTKDKPSNLLLTYIRVEVPERRDLSERQEPMSSSRCVPLLCLLSVGRNFARELLCQLAVSSALRLGKSRLEAD